MSPGLQPRPYFEPCHLDIRLLIRLGVIPKLGFIKYCRPRQGGGPTKVKNINILIKICITNPNPKHLDGLGCPLPAPWLLLGLPWLLLASPGRLVLKGPPLNPFVKEDFADAPEIINYFIKH